LIIITRGLSDVSFECLFKDNAVIPDIPLTISDGTKTVISIEEVSQSDAREIELQKTAWHEFFNGIRSLDEDLPLEFDAIIERGINFNKVDFS
jgi:hypothetical protein